VLVLTPLALHEVLGGLAQAAQTLTRAQTALARVVEVLEAEPVGRGDAPLGEASDHPSVHVAGLTIGWPGFAPVTSGISFDLTAGESVAVVGPSGVGKTTLAATVLGLIPPVDGEVTTAGRVGYLAQDAHLFATTIAENVRIGNKDATDAEVVKALAEAGLPLDPDRVVGELGATLSVRRGTPPGALAAARRFVRRPRPRRAQRAPRRAHCGRPLSTTCSPVSALARCSSSPTTSASSRGAIALCA